MEVRESFVGGLMAELSGLSISAASILVLQGIKAVVEDLTRLEEE